MSDTVDRQAAAASLAAADELAAGMRKDVSAMAVAVAGSGIGSATAMLIIGLVGMNGSVGAIVAGTIFLIGSMIPLLVVGVTAKAKAAAFTRRYLFTIGAWGVIYAVGMIIGGFLLPGVAAFWIPVAILSAVPGLWFAFRSRSVR